MQGTWALPARWAFKHDQCKQRTLLRHDTSVIKRSQRSAAACGHHDSSSSSLDSGVSSQGVAFNPATASEHSNNQQYPESGVRNRLAADAEPDPAHLADVLLSQRHTLTHSDVVASLETFSTLLDVRYDGIGCQQQSYAVGEALHMLLHMASAAAQQLTTQDACSLLHAVLRLNIHPAPQWYAAVLPQAQQQHHYHHQQQDGDHQFKTYQQQKQQWEGRCVPLDSQLLQMLIQHSSSVQELQAVLQPCWHSVRPLHTAAALQQLAQLQHQLQLPAQSHPQRFWQQQQQQQAEDLPGCQQLGDSIGSLGQQVIQHAAALAAPGPQVPSAAAISTSSPQVSHSSSFTASEVSSVLHAVGVLQLLPDAPQSLLPQLLQHAAHSSVNTLTAQELLQLLQGAAWMLQQQEKQPQQQQQQSKQQQQQSKQQQQALCAADVDGNSVAPPLLLEPTNVAVSTPQQQQGQQHQQHEQPQPQQLQQQQDQQQQRTTSSTQLAAQRAIKLTPEQQHALLEEKRRRLLHRTLPRQQQQQEPTTASKPSQQLLGVLLQQWCTAAVQQGVTLLPTQLSLLLSMVIDLEVVLQPLCLQQLLQLAGLHTPQLQQQQQQQQQPYWAPADAANVLARVASLLQAAHTANPSSSRAQQLLAAVQQHTEQLLLMAVAPTANHKQQQQQVWPVAAALRSVATLLSLQTSVFASNEQSSRQLRAGSGGSSSYSSRAGLQQQQQQLQQSEQHQELLVSSAALRVLMDVLLAAMVPHSQQQQQQQGQQQGQQQHYVNGGVLSCTDAIAAAAATSQLFHHQRNWHKQHLEYEHEHGSVHGHAHERGLAADRPFKQCEATPSSKPQSPATNSINSGSSSSGGGSGNVNEVRPVRFKLWLSQYMSCALHPTARLRDATAADLVCLFDLLVAHEAHMPPWWLAGAEAQVLRLVAQLCAAGAADMNGAAAAAVVEAGAAEDALVSAAKLLHCWTELLRVQPKARRVTAASSKVSSSTSSGSSHSSSSDAAAPKDAVVSGDGGLQPYFLRSSSFMQKLCPVLQPVLRVMDPSSLGLAAAAVAVLGMPQQQHAEWVQHLLAAVAAAADRAKGSVVEGPTSSISAAVGEAFAAVAAATATDAEDPAVPTAAAATAATAAAAAVGQRVPGEAVVRLLQSFALLRIRPPQPLLARLLLLLRRDMVLERGPVLVSLLVALSRLRYRPAPGWLRDVLLRLQGRLRLLSFDELAQLSWSLALLGVQPPQAWQDDYMDAAAVHILAERQRQQDLDAWYKQQQQMVQTPDAPAAQQQGQQQQQEVTPAKAVPRPLRRHPTVHPWQLSVVYWTVLRGWRYRSSHRQGALQWRAVRELNRAARTLPQQQQPLQELWEQQPQRVVQMSQQQQQQQQRQRRQRNRSRLRQVGGGWRRGAAVLQHRGVQLRSSAASSSSSSSSSSEPQKVRVERSKSSSRAARVGTFGVTQAGPWFEGALWPKQWRLTTLPSQQHTRNPPT